MNSFKLFHPILLSILLSLMIVGAGSAQEQTPLPSDDDVNKIARQMYCPVCENIPLDVCDTKACVRWRDLIREKLAEGWSADQIKDYFALQFGDQVLADPPRRGFNWLVYILPAIVFLGGVTILYSVLHHMRRKPDDIPPVSTTDVPLDTYENRVEEALRERRK